MPSQESRIRGGLVGLLVGDALGVPYEFKPARRLPPADEIEFKPPANFERSHPGVPPGTWSDDGAQALCLLESLLMHDSLHVVDFGRRMVNWWRWGHLAVDHHVFDIGIQTSAALSAIEADPDAPPIGPSGVYDNGNGSLMRVLPLALWHKGDDAELIADAMAQSRVTHAHLRSQLCCALYCMWARRSLEGQAEAWQLAVASVRKELASRSGVSEELDGPINVDGEAGGKGSGYVVDCLHSARGALRQGDFESCVRAAVALGDDTDTTAAVAGGIAGIVHGLEGIPKRWREALRGQEMYQPLLDALVARAVSN